MEAHLTMVLNEKWWNRQYTRATNMFFQFLLLEIILVLKPGPISVIMRNYFRERL
jgi:hypothetical protein